jgi:hypothetical protein
MRGLNYACEKIIAEKKLYVTKQAKWADSLHMLLIAEFEIMLINII